VALNHNEHWLIYLCIILLVLMTLVYVGGYFLLVSAHK
jgi:hypothetical protein